MSDEATTITQPDGYPVIHVWRRGDEVWACCASDHGPMCRLCQEADEVLVACLLSCADGQMLARAGSAGDFKFKATAKGVAHAEDLMMSDPEMAAIWADLQGKTDDR